MFIGYISNTDYLKLYDACMTLEIGNIRNKKNYSISNYMTFIVLKFIL